MPANCQTLASAVLNWATGECTEKAESSNPQTKWELTKGSCSRSMSTRKQGLSIGTGQSTNVRSSECIVQEYVNCEEAVLSEPQQQEDQCEFLPDLMSVDSSIFSSPQCDQTMPTISTTGEELYEIPIMSSVKCEPASPSFESTTQMKRRRLMPTLVSHLQMPYAKKPAPSSILTSSSPIILNTTTATTSTNFLSYVNGRFRETPSVDVSTSSSPSPASALLPATSNISSDTFPSNSAIVGGRLLRARRNAPASVGSLLALSSSFSSSSSSSSLELMHAVTTLNKQDREDSDESTTDAVSNSSSAKTSRQQQRPQQQQQQQQQTPPAASPVNELQPASAASHSSRYNSAERFANLKRSLKLTSPARFVCSRCKINLSGRSEWAKHLESHRKWRIYTYLILYKSYNPSIGKKIWMQSLNDLLSVTANYDLRRVSSFPSLRPVRLS